MAASVRRALLVVSIAVIIAAAVESWPAMAESTAAAPADAAAAPDAAAAAAPAADAATDSGPAASTTSGGDSSSSGTSGTGSSGSSGTAASTSFAPSFNETSTAPEGSYSLDAARWVWPTANDPNAENLIHSILSSWCGETYVDAVKDASTRAGQFDRLRSERDQRYAEWLRCNQERSIRERELEMECERERQVVASAFDRERVGIRAECDTDANAIRAELEHCEIRLKKKGAGSCQKDVAAERSACEQAKRGLQEELEACEATGRVANVSRVVALEQAAVHAGEERVAWAAEKKTLVAEVHECRPAQVRAQRRLNEVLTDGKVQSLEKKVTLLQTVMLSLFLVLGLTGGGITVLFMREKPGGVEGGYGWIPVMAPARLRLVDAEGAKDLLVDAFEGGKGSRLAIVLATDVDFGRERGDDPPTVYLLVPINITSSRRFSLFNEGGDYTHHVERAQEIVNRQAPNARLVVVLYEAGGCVFTEATLQSLRLTADKIAFEAVPTDAEFPTSDHLVLLWLDKHEGLRASDSAQESDLTADIKSQPWAQYLLMRSGRWGQVHAQ
ncbi:unnamed protein product, partial [Closterium sp. Yama58-4]